VASIRPTQASWAQEVEAQIIRSRDRVIRLDESDRERINWLLDVADNLTTEHVRLFSFTRLSEWWFGSRVEKAWSALHEAELLIVRAARGLLLGEMFEEAMAHAAHLSPDDPARLRLEKMADGLTVPLGGTDNA
jgi:hypothetical protein